MYTIIAGTEPVDTTNREHDAHKLADAWQEILPDRNIWIEINR